MAHELFVWEPDIFILIKNTVNCTTIEVKFPKPGLQVSGEKSFQNSTFRDTAQVIPQNVFPIKKKQ